MLYDCAIVGTGPAGMSAALNLKIRNRSFIWIGSKNLSDKIARAERVSNYPGLPGISGAELNAAFKAQIESMGIGITEAMVNQIYDMGDRYALSLGADFCEAKTVILAVGTAPRNVLPGEAERIGAGVSYCATCDGALYRGKTVAVVSTNARFEHEVKYLADLAEKVYFLPSYKNPGAVADNAVTVAARPVRIEGEKRPLRLVLSDGGEIAADGIFFLRDSIAPDTLLPGLASENGHIAADRNTATNLPGIFAAGDCTGRPYQIAKAVGEGNAAAHGVIEYLAEKAGG